MKYLINLLFLLGAAFFLGGCSDDDDPVDTPRLEVSRVPCVSVLWQQSRLFR